jgi:hypothetical protein
MCAGHLEASAPSTSFFGAAASTIASAAFMASSLNSANERLNVLPWVLVVGISLFHRCRPKTNSATPTATSQNPAMRNQRIGDDQVPIYPRRIERDAGRPKRKYPKPLRRRCCRFAKPVPLMSVSLTTTLRELLKRMLDEIAKQERKYLELQKEGEG